MLEIKIILLSVSIVVIAVTTVGYAEVTTTEISITGGSWNEIVDMDGNITIDSLALNFTNTDTVRYQNFENCAQITLLNTTKGDDLCVKTGTMAPMGEAEAKKDLLKFDFAKNFKVANLDTIAFKAKKVRDLIITMSVGSDVEIKSDEATIMFDEIKQQGNIEIKQIIASMVPQTVSASDESGQVSVKLQNKMLTSISNVAKISTNATFSGDVMVSIPYDESLIPQGVSENQLKLLKYNGVEWVEVSSQINTDKKTVSGTVSGFSEFMVVSPPTPPAPPQGSPTSTGSRIASPLPPSIDLHLYEILWNTCDKNIITIIAGPPSYGLEVKMRTSMSGIVFASLSENQPYANKSVFEAKIDSLESYVVVQVQDNLKKPIPFLIKAIKLDQCLGTKVVEPTEPTVSEPTVPTVSEPNIPADKFVTEFTTKTPEITGGKKFEASYNGIDFEINYKTKSGKITSMTIDEDDAMLMLTLDGMKAGQLVLSLPRGLIDAVDDKFVLFETETGKIIEYSVLKTEPEYVEILITLPDEISEITLVGVHVATEFGLMVIPVLLGMILLVVLITKYKLLYKVQSSRINNFSCFYKEGLS